jgi:hypothetical protein
VRAASFVCLPGQAVLATRDVANARLGACSESGEAQVPLPVLGLGGELEGGEMWLSSSLSASAF